MSIFISYFFIFFFFFCSRYLKDRRAYLQQIFQEDDKWAATKLLVSELFRQWEGDSKRSLSLHKMQNGSKMDLLLEKRKLSDFSRIISIRNAEKCAKNCEGTADRSFGAFSVNIITETLDSKRCHQAFTFFSSYSIAILSLASGSGEPFSPPSLSTASTSCVPRHRSISSQANTMH